MAVEQVIVERWVCVAWAVDAKAVLQVAFQAVVTQAMLREQVLVSERAEEKVEAQVLVQLDPRGVRLDEERPCRESHANRPLHTRQEPSFELGCHSRSRCMAACWDMPRRKLELLQQGDLHTSEWRGRPLSRARRSPISPRGPRPGRAWRSRSSGVRDPACPSSRKRSGHGPACRSSPAAAYARATR